MSSNLAGRANLFKDLTDIGETVGIRLSAECPRNTFDMRSRSSWPLRSGCKGAIAGTDISNHFGAAANHLRRPCRADGFCIMKERERISGKEAVRVAEDMASGGPVRVAAPDDVRNALS